jgi:hypothetical protein
VLRLFKSKSVGGQFLVIILLLAALYFLMPFHPIESPKSFSPFYEIIYNFLSGKIILQKILLYSIILLTGISLSIALQFYRFVGQYNYLPTFVYFSLLAGFPFLMQINQISLSSLLLLWLIIRLNKLEVNENYKTQLVSLSFLVASFSLIYLPNLSLLLLIVFGLIIFNKISFSELSIMIISALTPYLYLVTDSHLEQWNALTQVFDFGNPDFSTLSAPIIFYPLIIILAFFFISLYNVLNELNKKLIGIRRKISLISWLFVILIVFSAFSASLFEHSVFLFLYPITIIISFYLSDLKRPKTANIVMTIAVILIIANLLLQKLGLYVN